MASSRASIAVADVFISYSRRDGEFVRALHTSLTESGRDVWVDWQDIPPTSKWQQDIDDSIDAAESFVFVLSPDSLASEYCRGELQHAVERGKRIVPIGIDGARPEDAPPELRELNWIWWRADDDADAALAKLASALDTDLEWSRAHTRLLVRAVEWDARRDGSLLLRGKDLAEAERTLAANAGKEPRPTELQERYLHQSRRSAARRQRALLGGVTIALAVSAALGVLALLQRNDARSATRKATSVALSSTASLRVASNPDQALLLALAAYRLSPSPEARGAAFTALQATQRLGITDFLHGDSQLRGLAAAPDGRTAVTGHADGSVRLWDVSGRKPLTELSPPGGSPVVGVGFAREGTLVAAGGEDGKVRLWDARSGQAEGRVLDAGGPILASAVSEDGRLAAAINRGGRVWLWKVAGGEPSTLTGPEGDRAMLAFSPDGKTLAAGSSSEAVEAGAAGLVRLWDLPSGEHRLDIGGEDTVHALAFAPDSRRLAIASSTNAIVSRYALGEHRNEVVLRDVETGGALLSAGGDVFESLAFDPGGKTIAGATGEGTVRLLRAADLKPAAAPLQGLRGTPAGLAFVHGGKVLAAAAAGDTSVRLWDLDRDEGPVARLLRTELTWELGGVAVSPDSDTVALAFGNEGVALVPAAGGASEPRLLADPRSDAVVELVAFSGDGGRLAESSDDGSIRLWDLPGGKMTRIQPPANDGLGSWDLSLDWTGDVLAAVREGRVHLRDLPGGKARPAPPLRDAIAAVFVADGSLLTITGGGDVRPWDVERGAWAAPAKKPVAGVVEATVSADGRTVAFADDTTEKTWVWDRRGQAPAGEVPAGEAGLALSGDGRTLVVGSQLWDVQSRTPLGKPLPGKGLGGVAFTPDGRAVIGTSGEGVNRWDGLLWSDADGLRSLVCGVVTGDLTRAEWSAIAPGLSYRTSCS